MAKGSAFGIPVSLLLFQGGLRFVLGVILRIEGVDHGTQEKQSLFKLILDRLKLRSFISVQAGAPRAWRDLTPTAQGVNGGKRGLR